MNICEIDGCENTVRCRNLCEKHYKILLNSKKLKDCACGCGQQTIYTYKHGHHTKFFTSEEQSRRGRMNDGSALRDRGEGKSYRKINQKHEHRIVAENKIGRPLVKGEIVHHLNHNKRDNRPENLIVMTQSEHFKLHLKERYGKT